MTHPRPGAVPHTRLSPGQTPTLQDTRKRLYITHVAQADECRLRDGRPVVLREAGQDDVPALARLFMELSPRSSFTRFLMSRPAAAQISLLASLDRRGGTVCLVVTTPDDPGHLIAEGRYTPTGDGSAELGLTVLDAYQGLGLGRLLLDALVRRAHESGLERMRAIIALTNGPMLHLLEPYKWILAAPSDDAACLEFSVSGGVPGWPAAVAGQRVLVERRGWFDNERVAALRDSGCEVRQCTGPRPRAGRACPLLTGGRCRLAEEADLIVPLLPAGDEGAAAVLETHRRLWPDRLAQ